MNFITGATLRRFWPALAVSALLGISLIAPSAPLGASDNVAFGYGNNCGVKGYGYHDHGKPCPNRPFPGKGKGVIAKLAGGTTAGSSTTSSNGARTSRGNGNAATLGVGTTTSNTTSVVSSQPLGKGHHGKGHGGAGAGSADSLEQE